MMRDKKSFDIWDVFDRLKVYNPKGEELGLERIIPLLKRLGNPQEKTPPIFHVAGTNGKGSTLSFLRSILEANKKSIHVFTSPHLIHFNERIRLAGTLITDEQLSHYMEQIEGALLGDPITFLN